jgi:lysophospholipase L1-like esterase
MHDVNRLAQQYGFTKPYNFPVALLAVCHALLFFLVVLSFFAFWGFGQLVPFDRRSIFFIYVAGVALAGAAFARAPAFSSIMLALLFCDLTLSLGLTASNKVLGTKFSTLLPAEHYEDRFIYHPLLQGVLKKNFKTDRTVSIEHNAAGQRVVTPLPSRRDAKRIYVFGGSTTYDIGVSTGKTWVDRLQIELGRNYRVANLGVPGYSSVEHVIQTAFYSADEQGFPDCAVYYMGWNDIRSLNVPDLDPGYANFHIPGQIGTLRLRDRHFVSPVATILLQTLLVHYDTVPAAPAYELDSDERYATSDIRLEEIYRRNVKTIAAINRARNVRSVFIGQLLNRERLTADDAYGWLPKIRDKDAWSVQSHYNAIMEQAALESGGSYIGMDIDTFMDADFVDNGHFSELGAAKFASGLSGTIANYCR